MVDVYAVSASLTLNDRLSAALRRVSEQLRTVDSQLSGLQKRLSALKIPALQFRGLGAANRQVASLRKDLDTLKIPPVRLTGLGQASRQIASLKRQMSGLTIPPVVPPVPPAPPAPRVPGGGGRGAGGAPHGGGWRSAAHGAFTGIFAAEMIGHGVEGFLNPSAQYAHELNTLRARFQTPNPAAMAAAEAAAWNDPQLTVNPTQKIKMINDMTGVMIGGIDEAINFLPSVSKMAAALRASTSEKVSGNADDIAFQAAKLTDIMGINTSAGISDAFTKMARVVIGTQGRITPEMMGATTFYERQARYGYDDSMRWGIIPAMMLERAGRGGGGGSRGIGPALAAIDRLTQMGIMTKASAAGLSALGLLEAKPGRAMTAAELQAERVREKNVTGLEPVSSAISSVFAGGFKNKRLWSENPFFATWSELVPAIENAKDARGNLRYPGAATNPEIMRSAIASLKLTQQASAQLMQWSNPQQAQSFLRELYNIGGPDFKDLPKALREMAEQMKLKPFTEGGGAMSQDQLLAAARTNDPLYAWDAVRQQWNELLTVMGHEVMPLLIPAMITLSKGLHNFAVWGRTPTGQTAIAGGEMAIGGLVGLAVARYVGRLLGLGTLFRGAAGLIGIGSGAAGAGAGATAAATAAGGSRIVATAGALSGLMNFGAGLGALLFTPDKMLPKETVEARKNVWDAMRRGINRAFTGAEEGHENLPPFGYHATGESSLALRGQKSNWMQNLNPPLVTLPGLGHATGEAGVGVKAEAAAPVVVHDSVEVQGTLTVNMGELGSLVQKFVMGMVKSAMDSPAATGARPTRQSYVGPT